MDFILILSVYNVILETTHDITFHETNTKKKQSKHRLKRGERNE